MVRADHGLGHESAGVVIKVGQGVTSFKEGSPPMFLDTDGEAIVSLSNLEFHAPSQRAFIVEQGAIMPVLISNSIPLPHTQGH